MSISSSESRPITGPVYSDAEELTNVITHGFGVLIAAAALMYIVMVIPPDYSFLQKGGAIAYGVTLMLMFLTSTLYHATKEPFKRDILRRADHCSIFLVIAGTYTPILTISLHSDTATALLLGLWVCAIVGVVFKVFFTGRFEILSVITYLAMGWSSLFVIYELAEVIDPTGLLLLLVGGGAYSIGVVFYGIKAISFNHAIWHCCVLVGSFSHCWLILGYVLN